MSDDKIPEWVPHVAPGLQADVYPVSPPAANSSSSHPPSPPAELRLDRHAVVHGFSERRLPFEFASYLPPDRSVPAPSVPEDATPSFSATDFAKLREGLTELRRTPPTALQRVDLNTSTSPRTTRNSLSTPTVFPFQKPSSVTLDDWLSKLSPSSTIPTSLLSRSIPLGPAIARSANKIIEMMSSRAVPSQRAVWYIRIAVLNECLKHVRPDRPPLSPRDFWTRQLVSLLRSDTDSIRARKAAHPDSADRVTFWRYLLDIVRWQADENLLDLPMWLNCVAEVLQIELVNAQTFTAPGTTIAIMTTRRFLHEFIADVENARLLCKVLLPGADIVVKLWRASCQIPKVVKPASRKAPKRNFVPNSCHAEMTFLLSAALQVLDPSAVHTGPKLRVSDMERFVNRGFEIVSNTPINQKMLKIRSFSENLHPAPVHHVMREFEMLSSHGDVRRIVAAVQSTVQDGVGAVFAVVNTVCNWALVGPVSDHAEAISIASAVLTYLSASLKTSPTSATTGTRSTPKFESALQGQSPAFPPSGAPAVPIFNSNSKNTSPTEPILQRELWTFLKEFSKSRGVDSLEKEDYVVRFIAQLCRLDILSLQLFVRDVSRLTSCNHSGTTFLVKCLSLLPDPSDRSVANCRRSLLRKYGYASTSRRNYSHGIEDSVLAAARSGNMSDMESQAESLIATGNTNVILSTSEAVRLTTISQLLDDPTTFEKKLYTMITFLLSVDEPGMAVEWLLDNLGQVVENEVRNVEPTSNSRAKVMFNLVRLAEDLSRHIAACGHLDTVFNLLLKGYQCQWITSHIRSSMLHTLSSYGCTFGAASMNGSMYWTELVIRALSQTVELSKSVDFVPFALASLRCRVSTNSDDVQLPDLLNAENKLNWGVTPDEDLELAWNLGNCQGIDVVRLREHFYNKQLTFPVESLFLKGLSANDLMGCIFIPALSDALSESNVGTAVGPFSKLAKSVLHIVESRQNDVRMQGVRRTLVVDFMALIIAGCVCIHIDPSESLDVLSRMRWIWKVLASRAGIELARRLRSRVDYYCDKTATTDKSEVAAMMSSMVARLYGEAVRDEIAVSSSIGTEPFGMIELQLALFAINRRECGEEDEFGTNVSEASYADEDCAHSLTVTALECCAFDDEYRRAMAGIMAYNAAQAMVQSLNYVVTGLTMETSKSTAIHQERARQWYDADRARRKALELCVNGVNEQVGDQVEAILFEQLDSAGKQLTTAMSNGSLPSDLLVGGQQLSDALESRLRSILHLKRSKQSPEIWRRRGIEIARFLKAAVPLLRSRAVQTCLNTLDMCIKNIDRSRDECGVGEMEEMSGDNTKEGRCESLADFENTEVEAVSLTAAKKLLQHDSNADLRKQLRSWLTPVMLWVEISEREALHTLIADDVGCHLKALNDEGAEVDTWKLLEGYGRGTDEVAAVPLSSFWRQESDRLTDRDQGRTVQLKRTYTTFSGLIA